MQEFFVKKKTLPEAYHEALLLLHEHGEIVPCPDWNTSQKECAMTMVIEEPLAEPMISRCIPGGWLELQQYVMEMLDGILDFAVDRGKLEYTYHQRMTSWDYLPDDHYGRIWEDDIDQISFVTEELKRNPYSRRAVIDLRNNYVDMFTDDPACLQHVQLFIRNGKLDADVLFRSNDAVRATFFNAFALIMLQKKIAENLGVAVGSYTHRANSFHAYQNTWAKLDGYASRIIGGGETTYAYEGDWKDVMESYIPNIEESIQMMRGEK